MCSPSSGSSTSSNRKRSYSDDANYDGDPKKLLLEASSDAGHSLVSNVHGQEGHFKMIISPIVGYDPSSVVSYTVSYSYNMYVCMCVVMYVCVL